MTPTRRSLIKTSAMSLMAAAVTRPVDVLAAAASTDPAGSDGLIRKAIPRTGEMIPVSGLGTARRYASAATEAERAVLRDTLRTFAESGGRLIDTAPSYGDAERIVGQLIAKMPERDRLFLSSKVGATGRAQGLEQIEHSFRLLRPHRIDLMSVHNLQDTANQLATLRELREAQLVRYIGLTTSNERQYAAFEQTMRKESVDFIQIDYALDNRVAAERLLPLARDRGMAVLVNLPFGRGRLFEAVRSKAMPAWAADFEARTWAQFFLKYLVSDDAVTCVIPGMARPEYVTDNLGAATGRLPDAAMRRRMEAFISTI